MSKISFLFEGEKGTLKINKEYRKKLYLVIIWLITYIFSNVIFLNEECKILMYNLWELNFVIKKNNLNQAIFNKVQHFEWYRNIFDITLNI